MQTVIRHTLGVKTVDLPIQIDREKIAEFCRAHFYNIYHAANFGLTDAPLWGNFLPGARLTFWPNCPN